MHALTLLMTIGVAVVAALQRDYLANFEELDYADEDIYAARPVGAYDGLYFGSNFGKQEHKLQRRKVTDFVLSQHSSPWAGTTLLLVV